MFWEFLAVVSTLAAVALAGSAVTFVVGTVFNQPEEDTAIEPAKLDAYREIMTTVIQLNRTALEIGEKKFHQEADKMLMDTESDLEDPHADVHEAYQRHYYLLDRDVYESVSDYVDYLVEYHEEGAKVGELLSLGGKVGAAMRDDLGLPPLRGQRTEEGGRRSNEDGER